MSGLVSAATDELDRALHPGIPEEPRTTMASPRWAH